jgi:hypothetical protein
MARRSDENRAAWREMMLLMSAISLAACRDPSADRHPAPRASSSAPPAVSASVPQRFEPGALRVDLRLAGADHFEITFRNSSPEPIVILRPGMGEHLAVPKGGGGAKSFPATSYRFEARELAGTKMFRGVYAPQNMFLTEAESKNAARAKSAEPSFAPAELKIAPGGTATMTADLPFELPSGDYVIRFWYSYFLSQAEVPAGWYSGDVEAPPVVVSADVGGRLTTKPGTPATPQACGMDLTLRALQNEVELAFVNHGPSARLLDIPVDVLVDHELPTATLKWEAIDDSGVVIRAKVGEHAPRLDFDGAERPQRPAPEAPTLVAPARGTVTLRAAVPKSIPNGSYQLRVAYDNFSEHVNRTDSEWCAGTLVSAPIRLVLQR